MGQPTGRAGCRSVAPPPGSSRARRRDADFDVDAYDPDVRDTPYDDLLEDDPGVEVAPPPSASDWITGVGAGGATTSKMPGARTGGESGGRYGGGYAAEAAARRHRWSATASYATGDFRPALARGNGFGNGFGYDADDLGDPCELDRDTIGYDVDDDPRKSRDGGVVFGDENDGAKPSNPLARASENAKEPANTSRRRVTNGSVPKTKSKSKSVRRGAGLGSSTQPDEHAADDDDAPPRKRPSVLDEPRIPHTRVPRKKFAQATLAFG